MADGIVQLAPDSTGKKVDTSEIAVGTNTVERQRIVLADNSAAANFALVDSNGSLSFKQNSSTSAVTSVAGAITSTLLLASNANRRAFYITNEAAVGQILYITFGATASVTSYTEYLNPGDTLTPDPACYTGAINGIWTATGAFARITELT